MPALQRWIQDGRLMAFKTPGGHYRLELAELQRLLRQYRMLSHATSMPDIRILIVYDNPSIMGLFVHILAFEVRPRGENL